MPKPISADYIYELPTVGQAAVSPDGERVAYVRSQVDGETKRSASHIELVPFSGGASRQITAGTTDRMPRWSPDGAHLAFVRAARHEDGTTGKAQLWLLPSAGGEARQLTEIAGGVVDVAWMPAGDALIVTADVDPDAADEDDGGEIPRVRRVNRVYYRADELGWRGDAHRQLFRVDVKGGPPKQLTRADHDCSSAAVSPDGRTIAFASTDRSAGRNAHLPGRFDLCLVAASGGRVRRRLPGLQLLSAIAWSPDGAEIAYVSMGPAGDPSSSGYVWVAGRRGGAPRRLTSDELSPIAEAPLAWIGNRILFTANTRGSSGVFAVTTKAGRVRPRRAESELADGPASFSADGRRFAFTASTLRRPSEVVAHDATTGSSRLLTGVSRDYLRDRAVGRTERFAVKRGDFDIDCFLTFPPAFRRNRRYPLILMIHGGPHGFYGTGWLAHVQVLAAQGYLVLWTNPRGSSTYGSDFLTRVVEDWGGEDYLDLMAAVDRVSQRSYVDGRRLGVMGYSYGGFMTSWVIGHTNRFKSAIVGAPVTNLWSMYGTTDIGVTFGERQWGGTPWRNFDHYVEHSPLTYAPKVETPVLLLHGELDIRCPIAQSEEYYVALKRMGKRVEFVRFPGGYHGFTRSGHPAMREAYVDEIVNWWKRTL